MMFSVSTPRDPQPVAYWLCFSAAAVIIAIALGGLTRLTESGLSMVDWQPLLGILPPLSEAAWQDAFRRYQAYPEYKSALGAMTLDDFRSIFWLEYLHRLWGRALGLIVGLPFLYFAFTGRLTRGLGLRLVLIFLLGGAQGLLGWYMVKSGLVDDPRVSPYRLTAHFALALVILGALWWTALDILTQDEAPDRAVPTQIRQGLAGMATVIFFAALSGAFVAGNDAGLAYNTFPLMNGALLPPDLWQISPFYRNFFENAAMVQLVHRALALVTLLSVAALALAAWRNPAWRLYRNGALILLALVALQLILGILTLLYYVPVALASLHQINATFLFAAALWLLHRAIHPRPGGW